MSYFEYKIKDGKIHKIQHIKPFTKEELEKIIGEKIEG